MSLESHLKRTGRNSFLRWTVATVFALTGTNSLRYNTGCTVSIPGAPHIYIPDSEDVLDVLGDNSNPLQSGDTSSPPFIEDTRIYTKNIFAHQDSYTAEESEDIFDSTDSQTLICGNVGHWSFYETFIKFNIPSEFSGYTIEKVQLSLSLADEQESGSFWASVVLIDSPWDENSLNFNSRPNY